MPERNLKILSLSPSRRTISSSKYVDDGSKYGVMSNNNNNHGMEEIKYVTSSCSLDGGGAVDPSKGPYGGNGMTPSSVSVPNGQQQQQMNQNGGGQSGGGSAGTSNVIMVANNCSGGSGEEDSMSHQQQQQQHQVKSEDNSHSYVLPPFLH